MNILDLPLLAFFVAAALAQVLKPVQIADAGARAICDRVNGVQLPPGDRPDPAERASLAGCVSVNLYFGLGVPADPVQARKCAYLEMERGETEPALGGRTILMMAYANGKGAVRNYDVALGLACAIGGAPQDVAGRVHQLARLQDAHWTGDSFSICDHSSGKALYGQCASLQYRLDEPGRENRLAAITKKWTSGDKAALASLRRAAESFFDAHARKEADLGATLEVQELAFLEDGFATSLEQFERGGLPHFSAADLRRAEAAMNARFASTQQGERRTWGTATREGISDAQRLWTAYRDAWVQFARLRYPAATQDSIRTWLTQERTAMLERFVGLPELVRTRSPVDASELAR